MTPELLWEIKRISSPAISPDGQSFVYGVTTYDVSANRGNTDLWLRPVAGGAPLRLTDLDGSESGAAWRPDGQWVGFLATTDDGRQWHEVQPDGSGLRQVTAVPGGISNVQYSPDGGRISFTARVKLDRTTVERYPDLPEAEALITDDLMYRHWDSWQEYDYSHLFVAPYEDGSIGDPTDLMPGQRIDTPLAPFGGNEQIAWSPFGDRIVYTAKTLSGVEYAVSTNSDLFLVDLANGATTNLTEGMMGYDVEPVFSPGGDQLAWLSMARDGYEADLNRLFVLDFDTGLRRNLMADYDDEVHGPVWSSDASTIWVTSDTRGTVQIFSTEVDEGGMSRVTEGVFDYTSLGVARQDDGDVLVATRRSMSAPIDIFRVDPADGTATVLTDENRESARRHVSRKSGATPDSGDGWGGDPHLGDLSPGLRPGSPVAGAAVREGRAAGTDEPVLLVPLELPAHGGERLHRGGTEPARNFGVRAGVGGADLGRLGRPGDAGPAERHRRGRSRAVGGRGASGSDRRELRRLLGVLAGGQPRTAVQDVRRPRRCVQPGIDVRSHGGAVLRRLRPGRCVLGIASPPRATTSSHRTCSWRTGIRRF